MNKSIFSLACLLALSLTAEAQSGVSGASSQNADYYIEQYKLDQAEAQINKNIKNLKRKRQPTEVEEARLERVDRMRSMLNAVERIVVVDSFVVDKASFLNQIKMSPSSGKLDNYAKFFKDKSKNGGTVHQSDFGNKVYFSMADESGNLKLYTSDLVGGQWTTPQLLEGLSEDGIQNYPFALSDGVTLYYGEEGEESIGGYDIFATRYDRDEKRFLQPENMGMPFNSPANDYMLAIDEFNQLGWLVTDRNQPIDSVCIYVFVPNEIRKTYDPNLYSDEELTSLARLSSIAETWGEKQFVDEARQRLAAVMTDSEKGNESTKEFEFVINDKYTYTALKDFKSDAAREKMSSWLAGMKQLETDRAQLEKLRNNYSGGKDAERKALSKQILILEESCEKQDAELLTTAKTIRNTEINALSR